ncbi:MAG TPA: NAD(+) diphosphatase [Polyangiales bacterium]
MEPLDSSSAWSGRAGSDRGLDRAAERREDIDYLEARLSAAETLLLPVWKGQPFARGDDLVLIRNAQAGALLEQSSELVFLGMFEGEACFAIDITPLPDPLAPAALSGSEPLELRALVNRLSSRDAELALYARALLIWHRRQQFCGICGHATRPRQGGHARVCTNPEDGTLHFPRTDPCVLILVRAGDECLLARSPTWPVGMFSALAGFVEAGESLEQAALREVREVTGLEIGELQYFGSQPWPFPASLMIGFVARASSREFHVDGKELESARWVSRGQLLAPDSPEFFVPRVGTLSGQIIAAFAAGRL